MNISGRTTVSKLKTMFKEEFGIGVRVYNGNRFAEDSATLASIRNGGDARKSTFELRGNMKVRNAEKLFKDVLGISIQIEDRSGKLADDNATIASLKPAKDVKPADKAAAPKAAAPEIKVGDCVKFGCYYQENSGDKTPIEWLVLQKSGAKVLLISRYALDCETYDDDGDNATWENCDLRKWLNDEFLKTAFTRADQEKIAVTKLANDNNAEFNTSGGNSTEDRVFCLSRSEADSLFPDDEARKCAPTPYAVKKGAYEDGNGLTDGRGSCWWWLRSPGLRQNLALHVNTDGGINSGGCSVRMSNRAVRPALWVNL